MSSGPESSVFGPFDFRGAAMSEEKVLPKQPKRPIVANPSTPGIQFPNRPNGKSAPQGGYEKRGD
jgi:hypothetical protein